MTTKMKLVSAAFLFLATLATSTLASCGGDPNSICPHIQATCEEDKKTNPTCHYEHNEQTGECYCACKP